MEGTLVLNKSGKGARESLKRKKFIELANKRVNATIKKLELIGNLSNRSNYHFTDEDVRKIFSRLGQELKDCQAKFEIGGGEKNQFKLEA